MKTSQKRAIWYAQRDKEIERRKQFIKDNGLEGYFNTYIKTSKASYNRALGLFLRTLKLPYEAIR